MQSFTPMLADVSDKVPTIGAIWIVTALVSMGGLALPLWRRRAAFIALPFIALWAFVITSEVRDPYVGPAIITELGRGYVMQAYIAAIAPLVFVAIGYWRHRHHAA
jgi:hypothetical protein